MEHPGWTNPLFVTVCVSTVFCAAINAYTLQVAYPLWRYVGAQEFAAVHAEYLRRLDWVITAPHVVMFFASAALLWARPACMTWRGALAVFLLNASVVAISAFVAGPVHGRFALTGVADEPGMRLLLQISAARTLMMFSSTVVLCAALLRALAVA